MKTGSYYIRVRKTGWFVWHQSFKDGARIQQRVEANAARDVGFKTTMSVDEARAHCSILNKENSIVKEKIRVAAKRVTELRTLDEALFPQTRIDEFNRILEEENFGSEEHLEKLHSHFNFIQKMCNELRILPQEYKDNQKRIYKYFVKRKISPSYASRLISFLNRWGRFASKASGEYYDNVAIPRGVQLEAIADSQQTKSGTDSELGVRTVSAPLTPEYLKSVKDKLTEEQYNWLFLSVWLGLRPEEVDVLHVTSKYKVHKVKGVLVVSVYQSKLKSIASEKRWKAIPLIYPEQVECVTIIGKGTFKRPIYKIMRKYVGNGISCYGGRKGFVDLMLGLGQKLEDISIWLGHKDIRTTWVSYKDRQTVRFTDTAITLKAKSS